MALLEKAAAQGHAYAMHMLGSIHCAREEHEQALEWYTKGAEAGLPTSNYNVGYAFDSGEGVAAPDYPAAADWYRRAADAGHGAAAFNLNTMYAVGRGRAWQLSLVSRPSFRELNSITRCGEHYLPVPGARRHA
jgi:TPR repeat protein